MMTERGPQSGVQSQNFDRFSIDFTLDYFARSAEKILRFYFARSAEKIFRNQSGGGEKNLNFGVKKEKENWTQEVMS